MKHSQTEGEVAFLLNSYIIKRRKRRRKEVIRPSLNSKSILIRDPKFKGFQENKRKVKDPKLFI